MKQKIVVILLIISLALIIFLVTVGIKIGNFQILSVAQLRDKNAEVNQQIDKVGQISSVEYPGAIATLESTADSLKVEKQKYEQLSGFSEGDDETYTTEKFDIDYLWTTIGKYATKHNIDLAMAVKKASGTGYYDLDFTIVGEYTYIIEFVKKLENDSELGFRIYNFKIEPNNGDEISLVATFGIKDVNINDSALVISQSTEGEETDSNDDTNGNMAVEQKPEDENTSNDLNQ